MKEDCKLLRAERFVDMRTGCSYRYVNSKTEYFRYHTHDYFEVFIMLQGNAVHLINGTETELTARDVVYVRAEDKHNYRHSSDEPFSFLNITFTKETLDELLTYLGEGYDADGLFSARLSPSVHITDEGYTSLVSRMESIRAISPDDPSKIKTALRVLLINIFSDFFMSFEQSNVIPPWLSEVCESMKHEGNFPYGISHMVALSGKSREHLTRSMRKYIGMSPSEFINDLRLNYIANMLINSNHRILDIIFASGFNTVSHATLLFRKKYGMSMSEFRRS